MAETSGALSGSAEQATTTNLPSMPSSPLGAMSEKRSNTSVWKRFRRHRLAMIGSAILLVLTVSAIFAPFIATHDPFGIDLSAYREGPSSSHYLGTDLAGRDMFSRL